MKTPKVAAIVYDFDGTLASGNCVEHGLLESLGITSSDDFWKEVKERTKQEDADQILTYMQIVAEKAMQNQQALLSPGKLQEFGKSIPLFKGLDSWFERINAFAKEKDLILVLHC